jgi:glyoxylase-like metal-dependent hydrolase (beta-lactamase superfamily II)
MPTGEPEGIPPIAGRELRGTVVAGHSQMMEMQAPRPIEWQLVSDGGMTYPRQVIFPDAPADQLDAAGVAATVTTPYNSVLVRTGGRLILVDGGLGATAIMLQAPAGRLLRTLAALGVEPGDIDDVIVTHAHADHVGGLFAGERATFPRARHHLARAEWNFWMDDDPQPHLPSDLGPILIEVARGALAVLERAALLELIDGDIEVAPGVGVRHAPGHTPGHLVVELNNGGDALLYLADAVLHELQFEHPSWTAAVDVDRELTVQTRTRLLARANQEQLLLAGFHLARTGRLTPTRTGYSLAAAP